MTDVEWRQHEHEQWRLELPVGLGGGPVTHTNPELTTIALYRGWVGEDALYVAVSTRLRAHSSLRAEARTLSRHFAGGADDGDEVPIRGARGARRVDGLMDVEEGYGDPPQWTERVTFVVAGLGRHEVAVLTIRRHPGAELAAVVEQVVASFELRRASQVGEG
jgi:hypothetical protein